MAKQKKEYDPVYLVVLALGVGLGFSGGAAMSDLLNGFVVGGTVGLVGCLVYYLIKKSRQPKEHQGAKKKFKM